MVGMTYINSVSDVTIHVKVHKEAKTHQTVTFHIFSRHLSVLQDKQWWIYLALVIPLLCSNPTKTDIMCTADSSHIHKKHKVDSQSHWLLPQNKFLSSDEETFQTLSSELQIIAFIIIFIMAVTLVFCQRQKVTELAPPENYNMQQTNYT